MDGGDGEKEQEIWVGLFAANENGMEGGGREQLGVRFEGLEWEFMS